MDTLTTFSDRREYERAARLLEGLGIEHTVITPDPAYARVGCPALAFSPEARVAFLSAAQGDIAGAGWVDFREPAAPVPPDQPREFEEDVVGRMAIVVLAACIADYDRLRVTAHFSGDVGEALPYLNAEHRRGSYVAGLPVYTFMDGHRMVSLFRDRVGIAKADDIVDAWACLERVRVLANDVWERRRDIEPSFEARRRPAALEVFKRLPGTNCGECGEATCMAFAWAVWRGDMEPRRCLPVFEGERDDLADALLAICAGLGIADE